MVCGERGLVCYKRGKGNLKKGYVDTSLVIKPADKGSVVVVMDRE